jgi:hypothetical protein
MTSFYVSTTGSNANNGYELTPFLTIPYAITQATNGDTIYVSSGTYNNGTTSANNVLNINKQLTIIGRTTSSSGLRPVINISTASQNTAVLCNASNITLQGLEFVHNPASVGSNDACISLAPGGTPIYPDGGIMVNENINIIDCKIAFTKFGVSSKAKYFSVKNCELVSKSVTTARSIAIYSQDGNVDILDNIFTASISNNAIELLHNNFATNDSYQNKRNGTLNFVGNTTIGINITRRAIFFEAGADSGLVGDSYSFNVSNNTISSTSDCMFLLQPSNPNFLNFISLITINNNTFTNNPPSSNNGLLRVASFVTAGGPLTTPINNPPKFLIYSNTINNTTLNLATDPYNVDNKNVLIFTGFSANSDQQKTGGLSTSEINQILSTSVSVPISNIFSNICFLGNTPIKVDQGTFAISQLKEGIHRIEGKSIKRITATKTNDKHLICIEKHALDINVPSQKTIITANHKIMYKGKMVKSKDLIGLVDNVYKTKYRGETLYNVLLETHETMSVNNMICETLSPENTIVQLYDILDKIPAEYHADIIVQFNNQINEKKLLKNY